MLVYNASGTFCRDSSQSEAMTCHHIGNVSCIHRQKMLALNEKNWAYSVFWSGHSGKPSYMEKSGSLQSSNHKVLKCNLVIPKWQIIFTSAAPMSLTIRYLVHSSIQVLLSKYITKFDDSMCSMSPQRRKSLLHISWPT